MALHIRSPKLQIRCRESAGCSKLAPVVSSRAEARLNGARRADSVTCAAAATDEPGKTVIVKNTEGDMPFPWSEKDPYKLPVSIDRVQKLLGTLGWEKPWVEQIVDRLMKGMLKTSEERCQSVITYLLSIGLKQDEICNMACMSVVLLGLNPETRLKATVEYLKSRGVTDESVPDLVLKHPRIFEYKVGDTDYVVDVVPALPPKTDKVASVCYFREGASFMVAPVSPAGPVDLAKAAELMANA
eukprot:gene11184-18798_t